ncbi:hypothetical protein UFOVP136_38 [uncultured Caudovirales phage]|uniref:Uncharacterized protein n=1 Tax=uncultured Caudovirales phage TaxID=2100421 RepID=A0A6J5LG82_9CAUD|nr:hypothetical protein UFOVP136_38 [uncultured Caudovirales phage]
MKLHLGIKDLPYGHAHGSHGNANATTGEVAEKLEKKYGVMEEFFNLHDAEIVETIAETLADSLADYLSGIPSNNDNVNDEISKDIKHLFKKTIIGKEFDGKIDGVATQASLGGVNHRKKKGVNRNRGVRPSFYDTHLYADSFEAWLDA